MKGMGGLELIKKMKEYYPSIKILVLTTFYDQKNIASAVVNGADGYLLKDSGKETIINGIKNLLKGQSILDNRVMQELSKIVSRPDNKSELIYDKLSIKLTKREIEIAEMAAEGYTNSQIAEFLYLTEGTIKNYISSIYDKLDIHDRVQLAVYIKDMTTNQ